jgi:hypothetical protein
LIAFSRLEISDGLLSQRSYELLAGHHLEQVAARKLSFALVTSSAYSPGS